MALTWSIWVLHKLWITSDSDSLDEVCHPFLSHAEPKLWTQKSQLVPTMNQSQENLILWDLHHRLTGIKSAHLSLCFPFQKEVAKQTGQCLSLQFLAGQHLLLLFSQPMRLKCCPDTHLPQTEIRGGKQICTFFAYLIPGSRQRFNGKKGWACRGCLEHAP